MDLPSLLTALAQKMGLDNLQLDADGQCAILFDDQYEITFASNPDDHALLLFSEVGSAVDLDLDTARDLLRASLLGAETSGAALALHEPLQKIILWKRLDADSLESADFEREINAFLPAVIAWKKRLAEPSVATDSATDASPSSFDFLHV